MGLSFLTLLFSPCHIEAPSVVQLYMFICSVFWLKGNENAKLERVGMTDFMPE